jgi:hypothetical protein
VKEETYFFLFFSFEASLLFASLIIDINFSIKAGEGTKEPKAFSLSLQRALENRGGREQRAYRLDRVRSLSPSLCLRSFFFFLFFLPSTIFFHASALRTRNEGKRS